MMKKIVTFLMLQLLVAVAFTLLIWVMLGKDSALSAVLGCAVILTANTYFTMSAFRHGSRVTPEQAVMSVYRGQAGRYVLVMVLFALVYRFAEVSNPLVMSVASFVIIMAQIIASALLVSNLKID